MLRALSKCTLPLRKYKMWNKHSIPLEMVLFFFHGFPKIFFFAFAFGLRRLLLDAGNADRQGLNLVYNKFLVFYYKL
jgi:hypothetical protein